MAAKVYVSLHETFHEVSNSQFRALAEVYAQLRKSTYEVHLLQNKATHAELHKLTCEVEALVNKTTKVIFRTSSINGRS